MKQFMTLVKALADESRVRIAALEGSSAPAECVVDASQGQIVVEMMNRLPYAAGTNIANHYHLKNGDIEEGLPKLPSRRESGTI